MLLLLLLLLLSLPLLLLLLLLLLLAPELLAQLRFLLPLLPRLLTAMRGEQAMRGGWLELATSQTTKDRDHGQNRTYPSTHLLLRRPRRLLSGYWGFDPRSVPK